jgi:Holliday junction resolvase RusA-like endonuclease
MQTLKLQKTDRRVGVIVSFLFEIPKSYSKQKRLECEAGARIPTKPDIDNLAKTILDGCNDIVYGDDSSVWHLTAFKRYCDADQKPHTQVKIQWDEPSE